MLLERKVACRDESEKQKVREDIDQDPEEQLVEVGYREKRLRDLVHLIYDERAEEYLSQH